MTSLYPMILSLLCAVWAIQIYRGNRRRLKEDGGVSRVKGWLRRGGNDSAGGYGPDRPRWSRLAGALIAIAAAGFVLGVIPAQGVLAAWTTTKTGLLAVGVADLALGFALYQEWWHGHGYHQRWTAVSCGLAGVCGMVTYAQWPQMRAAAAKILPGTAKAAAAYAHRTTTGKAAKGTAALHGATHSQYFSLGGVIVFVAVLLVTIGFPAWLRHQRAALRAKADERATRGGGRGRRGAIANGGPRMLGN